MKNKKKRDSIDTAKEPIFIDIRPDILSKVHRVASTIL